MAITYDLKQYSSQRGEVQVVELKGIEYLVEARERIEVEVVAIPDNSNKTALIKRRKVESIVKAFDRSDPSKWVSEALCLELLHALQQKAFFEDTIQTAQMR